MTLQKRQAPRSNREKVLKIMADQKKEAPTTTIFRRHAPAGAAQSSPGATSPVPELKFTDLSGVFGTPPKIDEEKLLASLREMGEEVLSSLKKDAAEANRKLFKDWQPRPYVTNVQDLGPLVYIVYQYAEPTFI
jgi:hypothetical protein